MEMKGLLPMLPPRTFAQVYITRSQESHSLCDQVDAPPSFFSRSQEKSLDERFPLVRSSTINNTDATTTDDYYDDEYDDNINKIIITVIRTI